MAALAGALVLLLAPAIRVFSFTASPVTEIYPLTLRSALPICYQIVKVLPYDAKVIIYCQSPGTTVSGYYGTSSIWDNISSSSVIYTAYLDTRSAGLLKARLA